MHESTHRARAAKEWNGAPLVLCTVRPRWATLRSAVRGGKCALDEENEPGIGSCTRLSHRWPKCGNELASAFPTIGEPKHGQPIYTWGPYKSTTPTTEPNHSESNSLAVNCLSAVTRIIHKRTRFLLFFEFVLIKKVLLRKCCPSRNRNRCRVHTSTAK